MVVLFVWRRRGRALPRHGNLLVFFSPEKIKAKAFGNHGKPRGELFIITEATYLAEALEQCFLGKIFRVMDIANYT